MKKTLMSALAAAAMLLAACGAGGSAPTTLPSDAALAQTQTPLLAKIPPVAPATQNLGPKASNSHGAAYGSPSQPYNPNPAIYIRTGVPDQYNPSGENTKTWNFQILDGYTAVIGGYTVDNQTGGVYKTLKGPAQLKTTVTDGFVSVIENDWLDEEWAFRIGEAQKYNWAMTHVYPPGAAQAAPADQPAASAPTAAPRQVAPKATAAPAANGERRTSGENKAIKFSKGEAVVGWQIVINGKTYNQCYFASAPGAGQVTNGVVNPWDGEKNVQPCA